MEEGANPRTLMQRSIVLNFVQSSHCSASSSHSSLFLSRSWFGLELTKWVADFTIDGSWFPSWKLQPRCTLPWTGTPLCFEQEDKLTYNTFWGGTGLRVHKLVPYLSFLPQFSVTIRLTWPRCFAVFINTSLLKSLFCFFWNQSVKSIMAVSQSLFFFCREMTRWFPCSLILSSRVFLGFFFWKTGEKIVVIWSGWEGTEGCRGVGGDAGVRCLHLCGWFVELSATTVGTICCCFHQQLLSVMKAVH